jgi:type I restriction enzyme, S subunit
MPGINLTDISKLKIIFPISVEEQQKIASILSNVDELINKYDKVIDTTKKLKTGLMQTLLTRGIGHKKFKTVKWLFGKEIEIPEEWEQKCLIEKCDEKPEYGAGESAISKDENLPRYIRITDLNDDGSLRNKEWKSIPREISENYLLNEGDVLFARTGATVGKTYLHNKKNGECVFAGYLIRFIPNQKELNSKFLFHFVHSSTYWKWLKSIMTWGVQPNVNAEQFSNMPLLLPPLQEQQKIAAILSSVDDEISKLELKKKSAESLKKGLMQKLLTGQIRVTV